MRPVQFILILMLITVVFLYFSRLRSGLVDRLAVLTFGAVGIIMAIFPDLTMKIAAMVGVGRGADLFIYLALVGLVFFCLVLYSKLRDVESSIAKVVREFAIDQAHLPDKPQQGAQPKKNPAREK